MNLSKYTSGVVCWLCDKYKYTTLFLKLRKQIRFEPDALARLRLFNIETVANPREQGKMPRRKVGTVSAGIKL